MEMTQAFIQPDIIKWARLRADVNETYIAKQVHIKTDKYVLWEKGEDFPTFKQAEKLAKALHVPFGYLYLERPPIEDIPIPDLRTIKDVEKKELSTEFRDLLNSILRKQNWYKTYLENQGFESNNIVGRFSKEDSVETIAADIKTTLGINDSSKNNTDNWSKYLSHLCNLAEENNIITLRSGIVGNNTRRKLSVAEFRGFAIYDKIAPFLFINSNDSHAAQIFTFMHEIAHLWIGISGISNIYPSDKFDNIYEDIENFCNKIAAEIIVPKQEFSDQLFRTNSLTNLARKFKASSIVILRQALELEYISKESFFELYEEEVSKQIVSKKQRSKGGDFYNSFFAKNSHTLVESLIVSVMEGRTLYKEAAKILDLKSATSVNKVAKELGIMF